jgi:hypothetical protein
VIEILNPTDLTPLDNFEIPAFEAGQDSGAIPFAIRTTEDLQDLLLVVEAQDPSSGRWLQSGLPPVDELWPHLRLLTGPQPVDWTPVGAWRALPIPAIAAGVPCQGELRLRPPATASALTWRFRLALAAAEHSFPLPPGTPTGILTGLGDPGHSALLQGLAVTASTPPDDHLHLAAGAYLHRGRRKGLVAADLALDQLDIHGEPLDPGQSYQALLTVGAAGLTLTKSPRSLTPERPAPPLWESPLAALTVRYQSGPTVLESTDLTDLRRLDRYQAQPGEGLQLRLGPGRAQAGGTRRFHTTDTLLTLSPNATRHLWQRANGAWELTAPDDIPETTALGPLWEITTDATTLTNLVDRRHYAADTVVLHLRGNLPSTPGPIADLLLTHDGLVLEDIHYRLAPHAATAGQTQLDLELEGATLYPSNPQDDQRPAWPWDAPLTPITGRIHEITELPPGAVLRLRSIEHPTGDLPAWAEAYLICRRKT